MHAVGDRLDACCCALRLGKGLGSCWGSGTTSFERRSVCRRLSRAPLVTANCQVWCAWPSLPTDLPQTHTSTERPPAHPNHGGLARVHGPPLSGGSFACAQRPALQRRLIGVCTTPGTSTAGHWRVHARHARQHELRQHIIAANLLVPRHEPHGYLPLAQHLRA